MYYFAGVVRVCHFLTAFVIALQAGLGSAYGQCTASFPFVEDFESGPAGWTVSGANADWTWGTPAKVRISSAGEGNFCWITGGLSSGPYNAGQKSWLESPCFDFGSLSYPQLSFLIFWDTERQYDGGNVQYSVNGGQSWINIGNSGSTGSCGFLNWFNSGSITNLSGLASPQQGWSGTTVSGGGSCQGGGGSGSWLRATACMPYLAGFGDVRFRFTFCSGTTCNDYDGIAIDSFAINDLVPPSIGFEYTCLGDTAVQFTGSQGDCPTAYSWIFNDPASGGNTSSIQSPVHVFSGSGNFPVQFTITERCFGAITVERTLVFPEVRELISSESCEGNRDGAIVLEVNGINNPQVQWSTNPPVQGFSIDGLAAGTYSATITGDSSCPVRFEYQVMVDSNPIVTNLPDIIRFCRGEEVLLDPGNFSTYIWSDGSTLPQLAVSDTGLFFVTVTDASGCSATDSVLLSDNCFTGIYVPGAFSPNSDGLNDKFRSWSADVENFSLKVYNKYSRVLFESTDQDAAWDGRYEGRDCPEGVYIWFIRFDGPDKKGRSLSGKVSLIR